MPTKRPHKSLIQHRALLRAHHIKQLTLYVHESEAEFLRALGTHLGVAWNSHATRAKDVGRLADPSVLAAALRLVARRAREQSQADQSPADQPPADQSQADQSPAATQTDFGTLFQ